MVPDCGLDERGSCVLDFGPRQFRVVLDAHLKPRIRAGPGKLRADLPPRNREDDPDKADAAFAAWRQLKKALREVLQVQARRLEDATIESRRWTSE
jgi:hypothetical protein